MVFDNLNHLLKTDLPVLTHSNVQSISDVVVGQITTPVPHIYIAINSVVGDSAEMIMSREFGVFKIILTVHEHSIGIKVQRGIHRTGTIYFGNFESVVKFIVKEIQI